MPQLSDSQLVVLTAACQRPDRCVFPITARLKGNAAGNVLKSLLNKGLIKETHAKRDDTVWRHDEERGRMTLVATKAAFAALGIDPRKRPHRMRRTALRTIPRTRAKRLSRQRLSVKPSRAHRAPLRPAAGTAASRRHSSRCSVGQREQPSTRSSRR